MTVEEISTLDGSPFLDASSLPVRSTVAALDLRSFPPCRTADHHGQSCWGRSTHGQFVLK
jgi:hypothetical protein